MIQSNKRPEQCIFANLTDYSQKCPDEQRKFFAYVRFTDHSYCLWDNIFAKNRSGAIAQVLLKFSDCGEYIADISIHETEY